MDFLQTYRNPQALDESKRHARAGELGSLGRKNCNVCGARDACLVDAKKLVEMADRFLMDSMCGECVLAAKGRRTCRLCGKDVPAKEMAPCDLRYSRVDVSVFLSPSAPYFQYCWQCIRYSLFDEHGLETRLIVCTKCRRPHDRSAFDVKKMLDPAYEPVCSECRSDSPPPDNRDVEMK